MQGSDTVVLNSALAAPNLIRVARPGATTLSETGRADVVTGIETTVTSGPATIRTGKNLLQPFTVYAGGTNTDTLTRIRRDVTQTKVTTADLLQDVFLVQTGTGFSNQRGSSVISTSFGTILTNNFVPRTESPVINQAFTRIVGTFNGIAYELTIPKAYDPNDPEIRAAIAAALDAVRSAGAAGDSTTTVGDAVRLRTDSTSTTTDTFLSEFQDAANLTVFDTYGPLSVLVGDDLKRENFVGLGRTMITARLPVINTFDRLTTTTDTFTTTTTIQVNGDPLLAVPPVPPPAVLPIHSTAASVGPEVFVYAEDGTLRFTLRPYENYNGTVTVAVGDVTGDGIDDIVTGSATAAGHVKVFDGATSAEIASFFAYENFEGGVSVAVGDVFESGRAQIITGAGPGAGPHVKSFDVTGGVLEVYSFFTYAEAFRGGVTVAAGDGMIVTGAGPGAGPHVKLFRTADGAETASFEAYEVFKGGVRVAMGLRSGIPTIQTGSGTGTQSHVKLFRLGDRTLLDSTYIGDPEYFDGVYVG